MSQQNGPRLIVDAHLDLAMNALDYNRDLRLGLDELREREIHQHDRPGRAAGTVSLPALRRGRVGLIVATQIGRVAERGDASPGWRSPQQAWASTQGQLAWYREMEALGELVAITDVEGLDRHLERWADTGVADADKPIGYILSLEGADSIIDPSYVGRAYAQGLRAIGPAHFGRGRYAPGTGLAGPLTEAGPDLLEAMGEVGMILDVTHLTDEGFDEALERYAGPVWASHSNARHLTPIQRHLSDDQVRRLIERGCVIGGMLDAWGLDARFIDRVSDPWALDVRMERLVDHWDHICQLAGDSRHVAIGTDLDGGFGREQSPWDLDSIADLRRFEAVLADRGYGAEDIDNIFSGNWIRFLREAWSR